jgi:Asp-tRNA(Asn)/Glu-tRNA(Gln) amidotransferase A subunit family amidase
MNPSSSRFYDPRTFKALTFYDAVPRFHEGDDSPRVYLERCIEMIKEREPIVKAFVTLNEAGARLAADESTTRWKAGRPLSAIDGMPIGIKDLLETKDMPTQMGCEAFSGNFPKRDNAAVWALRQAGAVILGKTTTAELGGSHPPATTNPFDPARTAGGSSSGSAAAVGAGMIPAAIGTQVGGSIIRPASYCGNFALKPSQGGINRGERQATSMSTHGVHAGCVHDMWQVAIEVAERAGGDRGCIGLFGPRQPPPALKPGRLIVLETAGWDQLDARSKLAFETLLDSLQRAGIQLLRRADHPLVEKLERAIADAASICNAITGWENRWYQRNLVNENPGGISERAKTALAKAEGMTVGDYRAALTDREAAQAYYSAVAPLADALVTLSSPGPAPLWAGDQPGKPLSSRPTGDPVFNFPSSMLFAPSVTMPLMAVHGMPLGAQVMGRSHEDAKITAMARWLVENLAPVVAA